MRKKLALLVLVVAVVGVAYVQFGDVLTLANLAQQESQLRDFQQQHPVLVYAMAFLIYVVVTGLSLPSAAVLTLVYGVTVSRAGVRIAGVVRRMVGATRVIVGQCSALSAQQS